MLMSALALLFVCFKILIFIVLVFFGYNFQQIHSVSNRQSNAMLTVHCVLMVLRIHKMPALDNDMTPVV